MEDGYYEEHVWPLTSSTSCYTGARGVAAVVDRANSTEPNNATTAVVIHDVRWATQLHTCSVRIEQQQQQQKPLQLPLHCRQVVSLDENEESKSNMNCCVGYSATAEWEALALLDVSKAEAITNTQQTQVLQQQQPLADDDASVMVTTTATSGSHHRRSSSFMSVSESSLPPTFPLDSSPANIIINSNTSTDIEAVFHGGDVVIDTSPSATGGEPASAREAIAQLILRRDNQEEYTTTLDFRPLAVTVSEFPSFTNPSENTNEIYTSNSTTVGVWLGSADNNKLHWFVPSDHGLFRDDNGRGLVPVALENPAFGFMTPIMAIDLATIDTEATSEPPLHCLAVACQDGTIRLVTFRYHHHNEDDGSVAGLAFQEIRHNQVIIDGPIVCLHLQQIERTGKTELHITAGSLCGYVAELYLDPETMEWQGPFMVAEGFWNARLNAEDSVLAVHTAENTVLIGTHAGRCLLYRKRVKPNTDGATLEATEDDEELGDSYQLQWDCQLPYPVHAVSCLSDNRLLVTTRRTVHLFRRSHRKDSIVAAALRAKTRLLALLEQQQEKQKQLHTEHQKTQQIVQADVRPSSPAEALAELPETDAGSPALVEAHSPTIADEHELGTET